MKKMLLTTAMLLLVCSSINAQTRTVTGRVIDEIGEPLPSATVLVKGTTIGATTNVNGVYSIDVPSGSETLVFQYLGYLTVEQEIENNSVINVTMQPDIAEIGEMVVVGYGVQRVEAITGSVGVLNATKIEQVPMASFESALQGNIAGVQSIGIDGAPGANTQIRIRGIGSITASSEPLYVIDGVQVQTGDITQLNSNGNRSGNVMASLNPNDIQSVTVLKDAASTAIYGSRGANGVIVITTKSGRKDAPKIQISSLVGFNSVASSNFMEPLNADQYTTLFIEGYTNSGVSQADAEQRLTDRFQQLTDPTTGQRTDTDWLDGVTRTGITQSHNLSASGGNDRATYFFSGSYYDQESHLIGSDFERLSSRVNLTFQANDNLSFSNNLNLSGFDQNGMVDGSAWANPLYNAFLLSPLIPVRDEQGRFNAEHQNYFPMGGNNPVGALSGDDLRLTQQLRLTDNFAMSVKFAEDFLFRSQWNVDVIQVEESQYKNRRYGDGRNSGGYAQVSTVNDRNFMATQTIQYLKEVAENHMVDALVGFEAQKAGRKTTYGYGESFPNDKLTTLASAAAAYSASATESEYSFMSYFAKANYDFKNKYHVSGSIRRDGSSRFGADNRWGTFYSFGGGWTITEEDFLGGNDVVQYLKLRTSYGIIGNAGIGNYTPLGLYAYGSDYGGTPGGEPSQIANPSLTWESQSNFNVGLDFEVFNKLSGTVEYFKRVSDDLILDVPVSFTTGFEELTQNFGSMENSGLELTLNSTIVNTRDLNVDVGFNLTFLSNELTKLNEAYTDGTKRREEGRDFQSYYLYGWAGVDQSNGDPLWYTDSTETTTTNSIGNAERYFNDKSATPDYYGGFNINASYKNFSLTSQFNFSVGNYIYDAPGRFIHGDGRLTPRSTSVWGFENRWVPGSTDALLPMHQWGDTKGGQTSNSTRYLYDATFLRLRNLTVSYNVDPSLLDFLSVSSVKAYVRGTNLLTITRDKDLFLDPEQAINGIANSLTPAIRTISLGIDLSF